MTLLPKLRAVMMIVSPIAIVYLVAFCIAWPISGTAGAYRVGVTVLFVVGVVLVAIRIFRTRILTWAASREATRNTAVESVRTNMRRGNKR